MTRAPHVRVDPAWLRLRGPADARARTASTSGMADRLAGHLARRLGADGVARLVDVGAGTGAGAVWLRARLPMDQDWRLVDRDADLLAAAPGAAEGWARGVVADVEDVPALLADEPAHVVTCQALLDVLTAPQADALIAPAVARGAALLLSLSVTGEVSLAPPHEDDELVSESFDAHQRDRGLGPDAAAYAATVLRGRGYDVGVASTPWRLGAAESALAEAWLRGYAAAAREQEPAHADRVDRWEARRLAAAADWGLEVVVGHVDVLALPTATGEAS